MNEAINKVNDFLKATSRDVNIRFKDGYFLQLKKHIRKTGKFLEIHTPGYDGTLPIAEAVKWIEWTIYDYNANGLI